MSRADRSSIATALAALRGLPGVLRERRAVADTVVRALRRLDAFDCEAAADVPGAGDDRTREAPARSTRGPLSAD